MPNSLRRSSFIAAAGAFASINVVRAPARAAEFVYKLGHGDTATFPSHIRLSQMAANVKAQTNGRMEIQIFPNGILGTPGAMFQQLRSGSIQFFRTINAQYGGVVPLAQIDSVGFAFASPTQLYSALDGPLGTYVRAQFETKGLYAFEKAFDIGFHDIAASNRPINSVADFGNLKIRIATAAIFVDMFKTLGASPTPVEATAMYTSMQTHVIDAVETPLPIIESFRLDEVSKYLSMTRHSAGASWLLANGDAWKALPADIQQIVIRNVNQAAILERQDLRGLEAQILTELRAKGMTVNQPDTAPMRAALGPYYGRWKDEFGSTAWGLLEASTGKLA